MFGFDIDKRKRMFYTCSCQIKLNKKKKPSYRCWRTIMIRRTFSILTHKFIPKQLEFEEQKCSLVFLHIKFKKSSDLEISSVSAN